MIVPPKPSNEKERLKALGDLLILDTPAEERFDRITQFASFEFNVPIVVISLVDEERQWFKSFVGLDVCSTPRDISFCTHAILQNEILIIEDSTKDERFFDNPLVTGEPHIRFYAGAQLILPKGEMVGTLCLIDRKPRSFDKTDMLILSTLRKMVVSELVSNHDKINKSS